MENEKIERAEVESLAAEIIRDDKTERKQLIKGFTKAIVCIVLLFTILEAFTIGGFLWYLSLPVEEVAQEQNMNVMETTDTVNTQTME